MNLGLWGAISPKTILGAIKRSSTVSDTTAPTAPTGLSATPVSTSQIDLAWTDASGDEAGFRVYRSTDGVNYSQLGTDLAAGTQAYNDTTVTAGTKYYYKVGVFDAANNEAQTTAVSTNTLMYGLVMALNLEEASGTRLDGTANHNDAAVVGDGSKIVAAAGKLGNAVKVTQNPGTNYLQTGAPVNVPVDAAWEVSIWVNLASTVGWTVAVSLDSTVPAGLYSWQLVQDGGSHKWYLSARNGSNVEKTVVSSTAVNAGEWHCIHFLYDKANTKIGINFDGDTVLYTTSVTSLQTNASWPIRLFATNNGSSIPANSMIDRFYIWNRLLTAAERTADYNGGAPFVLPF